MKREEMKKLILNCKRRPFVHGDGVQHLSYTIPNDELNMLLALARLGASVAEPSEEEIEAMARGICRSLDIPPDDWSATWEQVGLDQKTYNWQDFTLSARTAILALKDRAHV